VLGADGVGQDRIFVGLNDARTGIAPRTASVDVNLNAAGSSVPYAPKQVEAGMPPASPGRDGSSVRTAIHSSGIIYAAFYSPLSPSSANIIVVRDNHWGAGSPPFNDLKTGSTAGVAVQGSMAVPYSSTEVLLGGQPVGRSQISIAVDPNDASSVWVAWGDAAAGSTITLHLRHSADGGATWSPADLRTVPSATNPAVAVNSVGQVGFLYQQLIPSGAWFTQVELSSDGFATLPTPLVLSTALNDPGFGSNNQIGDYDHMMAVGKDFFGVFSADNSPSKSNFPAANTLIFQRENKSGTLYADASHTFTVQTSVDPFFFHIAMVAPENDFFVRDWNDGSGHDPGLEPSTHSVFYTVSDVWNELTNASGSPTATSAPAHADPQPGPNFAFLRVGRKASPAPGAADIPVTAHFLYSDFGVGMPYVDAGGGVPPVLTFQASDTELTLPDGQGYAWTLPAAHSSHVCMAAEIESPSDPFAKPDLNNNVPGWPTLDTAVLYDNNKAQRNIIYPAMKSGSTGHHYALVRNAANVPRSVCLREDTPADALSRLGSVLVDACGLASTAYRSGTTVCLAGMATGEVRALRVTITPPATFTGQEPPLDFTEVTLPGAAGKPRDGFAFSPLVTTVDAAARGNLVFQAAVFGRLAALYNDPTAAAFVTMTRNLLQSPTITAAQYAAFLQQEGPYLSRLTALVPRSTSTCAPNPAGDMDRLVGAISGGDPNVIAPAHSDYLNTLDIAITLSQIAINGPGQ